MHRRQALQYFAGLALCPLCARAGLGEETHAGPHWSYEGATGPDNWGGLDAANKVCSTGTQQSPIDLSEPISARQPALDLDWKTRPDTIVNNGHTIQLNFGEGSIVSLGKQAYGLIQFHFHQPSEHRVNGKTFAMEAHFVHAATDGRRARSDWGIYGSGQDKRGVQQDRLDNAGEGRSTRSGRSSHRSKWVDAGAAKLLPLRGVPHDTAVQRDRRLARAHRLYRGGRERHCPICQTLPDERPSGAKSKSPLRSHIQPR